METAAGCRYKTKIDKRCGFWQIDLTKRAQDLGGIHCSGWTGLQMGDNAFWYC